MSTWFTADLHLGHTAVLAFSGRPFETVEEHDEAIVAAINKTVGRNDRLYILGDFTMRLGTADVERYLGAIRCRNRWLVRGNHDRAGALFRPGAFTDVRDYMEVRVGGRLLCLSHYPMLDWNMAPVHHGIATEDASFMLHGHIHSQGRGHNGDNARRGVWRYDVGVDANGYRPVSFGEIEAFIAERDPAAARGAGE